MDYAPVEAFLIGRCGMTVEQAGRTTVREYKLRVEGHEQQERTEWERARWQMFLQLQMQPFIKPHSKPRTPQAWIRFPWEQAREVTREDVTMTGNEVEQLDLLLRRFKGRKRNGQDR